MTTQQRQFARDLRKMPTGAEDTLWQALRGRSFMNLKFRRQVPLLSYTVDFLCPELGLIIELDGAGHAERREYDAVRTAEIETQGFRVMRMSNDQVLNDLQAVLNAIGGFERHARHSPSPLPLSHPGEGFSARRA
jgi:very-short-patch-repair endonuclease